MVLSSVISGNLSGFKGEKRLFGIKCDKLLFVLSSWISGFIVGPMHLAENNDNEDITDYVILTSNAGIGFTVFYIGYTLWNSILFGIILFVLQLLSSVILFTVGKRKSDFVLSNKKSSVINSVTDSVRTSTKSVLEMCGFTVFFSVIHKIVSVAFSIPAKGLFSNILSSLLDISRGTYASVQLEGRLACGFFTGFTLGFGGLCMCFQTFSVCRRAKLKKTVFVTKKLLQGVICGLGGAALVYFMDLAPVRSVILEVEDNNIISYALVFALFTVSTIFCIKKHLKRKIISK